MRMQQRVRSFIMVTASTLRVHSRSGNEQRVETSWVAIADNSVAAE